MRKNILSIIALLAIVLLSFSLTSTARNVEIEVLFTSDLRGQVLPFKSYGQLGDGGVLRCATLIHKCLGENPSALLIDTGGALRGCPRNDILDSSPIIKVMNLLDYDVYVPSGPDFALGIPKLKECLGEMEAEITAANMKGLGGPNPISGLAPLRIFTIDGVRLAIAGISNPRTPLRVRRESIQGLEWLSAPEALRQNVAEIKAAKADVTVLTIPEDALDYEDVEASLHELIENFPIIDVVIVGGSGRAMPGVLIGDAICAGIPERGQQLGMLKIDYNTVSDRIESQKVELISAGRDIPLAADVKEKLDPELQKAEEMLDRVIGVSLKNYSWRDGNAKGVEDVVLESIREAVDADIAFHLSQNEQGIWEREQTERDIWRILPHNSHIGTILLTFNEIEAILKENCVYYGDFSFLKSSGIDYDLHVHPRYSDTATITDLRLSDGTVPHPRRRFRVACSAYLLASADGRFRRLRAIAERPRSSLEITGVTLHEALREYFAEHSPLGKESE